MRSSSFEVATRMPLDNSEAGAATGLAVSPDGSFLAAGFTTNQVQLLDLETGMRKTSIICGPEDTEVLLAMAPNGRLLATASLPDKITIWSADGREMKRMTLPARDEVRCLSFSADGRQLAVGCSSGGLRVWNPATGKLLKQKSFPNGVWSVAYTVDGKTLAVGMENAVVLLDARTYETVREYRDFQDTVACLAFAPGGRHLAAGNFSGEVRLFDLNQPKNHEPHVLKGHYGAVNSIAWSKNGRSWRAVAPINSYEFGNTSIAA